LLAAGCGPARGSSAPEANGDDPQIILAELTATTQLADAATQLADVLAVRPDAVRVLLHPVTCATCELGPGERGVGMPGLDVATAEVAVQPGGDVYLLSGGITCTYQYDGVRFTPQSCQSVPP
jgi:hypothetical protein